MFGYPGRLPGFALLLLRAVLGGSLIAQGVCYFAQGEALPGWAGWIAGGLLVAGFLTPVAAALTAGSAAGVLVGALPACAYNLFASAVASIFAAAILLAVVALGPGAFSLDARLYGRREIVIPTRGL